MIVSVVIPLYNKARHIKRAVDSVLGQSYQNLECIVVDDGSTDDGAAIVRQYSDPRVKLVSQSNAGVSAARNAGIRTANAGLIAFLDADDEWLPDFLKTVVDLRQRFPEAGMYATAYCFVTGKLSSRPAYACCNVPDCGGLLPDYFRSASGAPPISASSVMIPKSVLAEVGNFPLGIRRGEDLLTWTRIALRYRVAWSPIEYSIYHLAADNRACEGDSGNTDFPGAPEIERAITNPPSDVFSPTTALEYLTSCRLQIAHNALMAGRVDCAKELLAKTSGTVRFRNRQTKLRILLCMPNSLLHWLKSMRRFLKSRKVSSED